MVEPFYDMTGKGTIHTKMWAQQFKDLRGYALIVFPNLEQTLLMMRYTMPRVIIVHKIASTTRIMVWVEGFHTGFFIGAGEV